MPKKADSGDPVTSLNDLFRLGNIGGAAGVVLAGTAALTLRGWCTETAKCSLPLPVPPDLTGPEGRLLTEQGEKGGALKGEHAREAFSVVGDVLFTENDPTVIIDGNEIRLSVPAATIFKLLVRSAGKAVPRSILLRALQTNREDPELYLTFYAGDLRRLLGRYGDRVVTVKKRGYIYQKPSAGPGI